MVRQEQEATARAAFAAMTFQWLEELELSAGLRLSDDAKDYTAWRDEAPAVTDAGPLGPIHQNPQDTVWSGGPEPALPRGAGRADVFACGARVSDAKHSGTLVVWRRRHAGGYGDDSFL